MSGPLLSTKFSIPPSRPQVVARPRLMDELDKSIGLGAGFTLVCAKAGSGKTTLVSEHLHQRDGLATWISLDSNDNDPSRFLEYLSEALKPLNMGIDSTPLRRLELQPPPEVEHIIALLFDGLDDSAVPGVLVLDDYHHIENTWVHQLVGCLVEHHPPKIHPIIISRIDPPFPLARLRGQGQLHEIRDLDLRFTLDEVRKYFNGIMDLSLSPSDLSTLTERTEGWIVGLQMAGISMRGRHAGDDLNTFIEHFGGTNRYILDYLMDEVLQQQPQDVQDFLIETSILGRLCPALCDAVKPAIPPPHADREVSHLRANSGPAEGSQLILNYLEEANLFVIPLDDERRWYRYHHLFSDLLRTALVQARSADAIRGLHSRASAWYKEAGFLEEAMVHAMEAREYEGAASMIDENIVGMLSQSEGPVLLKWIEQLPKSIAQGRPWVDIYRAYTLALSGKPGEAGTFLDSAEQRIDPDAPRAPELAGHIAAIRSYNAHLMGEHQLVIEQAALAEDCLPPDHLIARGMSNYALAVTYFASGKMQQAEEASERMLAVGKDLDRLLMVITALCDLASVRKVQGSLFAAQAYYETAYEWLVEKSGLESRLRCPYEVGLADLNYKWNHINEAEAHANAGIEFSQRFHVPSEQVSGLLTLMRVQLARGDSRAALRTLHQAEQVSKEHSVRLIATQELSRAQAHYWLKVGDLKRARQWEEKNAGESELEQITQAQLWLAIGESARALERLQDLEGAASAGGRTGRLIEVLALKSMALQALGQHENAYKSMEESLLLSAPENYKRVFLDLGSPFMKLIQRYAGSQEGASMMKGSIPGTARRHLDALLQDFEAEKTAGSGQVDALRTEGVDQVWVERLTERELEVLRLLSQGLSNNQMAARLVVAPSTIKQHLKNIYRKLEVHSRTQAVSRGRGLRLI